MIKYLRAQTVWIFSAALCLAATAISFAFIDDGVMRFFSHNIGLYGYVSAWLGTTVLLFFDVAVALALVIARIALGKDSLPQFGNTLVVACLTSICAFGINDRVLKFIFGVPNPEAVFLQGARHTFYFLAGTPGSSFPSGHMILASSFAGVFMRLYPRMIFPLAVFLFLAVASLIVGDWHFVSDVIAGTALGIVFGMLAGNLWLIHTQQR